MMEHGTNSDRYNDNSNNNTRSNNANYYHSRGDQSSSRPQQRDSDRRASNIGSSQSRNEPSWSVHHQEDRPRSPEPKPEMSPVSATNVAFDVDLFNELNMTQTSSFIPRLGTVAMPVVEPSPPRTAARSSSASDSIEFDPFANQPELVLPSEAPSSVDSPSEKAQLKKKVGDIVKKNMEKYYREGTIKDKEEFKNLCRQISHKVAKKEKLPQLDTPATQLKIQKYIAGFVETYLASKKKKET